MRKYCPISTGTVKDYGTSVGWPEADSIWTVACQCRIAVPTLVIRCDALSGYGRQVGRFLFALISLGASISRSQICANCLPRSKAVGSLATIRNVKHVTRGFRKKPSMHLNQFSGR